MWKTTVLPDSRRSWASAASCPPGLPIASAPHAAIWSDPMMSAFGMRQRRGACLGLGEPDRGLCRRLVRKRGLVDVGGEGLEREAEARQKEGAVARRRGEHELTHWRGGRCSGGKGSGCCFC